MTEPEVVLVERVETTPVVTINRPAVRNAVNAVNAEDVEDVEQLKCAFTPGGKPVPAC